MKGIEMTATAECPPGWTAELEQKVQAFVAGLNKDAAEMGLPANLEVDNKLRAIWLTDRIGVDWVNTRTQTGRA
jgi:hypothetical protein